MFSQQRPGQNFHEANSNRSLDLYHHTYIQAPHHSVKEQVHILQNKFSNVFITCLIILGIFQKRVSLFYFTIKTMWNDCLTNHNTRYLWALRKHHFALIMS